MDFFGFAASALGSILGASTENRNTDAVNAANAQTLERQIAANKETMQNRHQWEVADLRAAGLNPLMSTTSPTGTLSAPNASPAQKSNSAQAYYQLGEMALRNKQLDIDKLNAQANSQNANTAANALEWKKSIETRQQDWTENSGQQSLNIEWQKVVQNEILNNSTISLQDKQGLLIDAQRVEQNLKNIYMPTILKAEADRAVQQVLIDMMLCQGQLELWDKQGNAALMSASAQQSIAAAQHRIAAATESLNHDQQLKLQAETEEIKQAGIRAWAEYNGHVWETLRDEEKAKLEYEWNKSPVGKAYNMIGIVGRGVLPFDGGSIRAGKNFGFRQ